MTWLTLIPCLMLAALPPLNDQQQQMFTEAPQLTTQFDQAALYALLQNAQSWSTDPAANEAGARLPDYSDIRVKPDKWQGEPCLVEGTLVSRVHLGTLSRTGYGNVESWAIRTPPASGSGGDQGSIVIAFLTNPPAVSWKAAIGNNELPAKRGMAVRIVARFYTIYRTNDTKGRPLEYPIFVGRTATFPHASPMVDVAFRPLLLVTLIFVMIVAYVIVIIVRIKRGRMDRSRRMEEKLQRQATIDEEVDEDRRYDLPEDPAAAMDTLDKEHDQQD